MFENPTARYLLRAGIATVLACLSALSTAIPDGISGTEWVVIATATVSALSLYLGVGAAVPAVEPYVGNKYEPQQRPAAGEGSGVG